MQRLRLKFGRGEELKFLSHLDLMRLWERALRRAGLPLAYSEGFTPHPRIALAAPLSVGVTSEAELMDVFLSRWIAPDSFVAQAKKQLPQGLDLPEAWPVGLNIPSLQSQVRFAEYKVEVDMEKARQEVESAVRSLLSAEELPWHHFRDTGARHYDLRALVDVLWHQQQSTNYRQLDERQPPGKPGVFLSQPLTLHIERRLNRLHFSTKFGSA
ncbi:hypothetical protein ES703_113018 [subsurface metagenome]